MNTRRVKHFYSTRQRTFIVFIVYLMMAQVVLDCVNVKHKTCVHPNCKVRPSYNFEGQTKRLYCSKHKIDGMTNEFIEAITNAEWRGNVRELKNVMERSAIVCDSQLTLQDLPLDLQFSESSVKVSDLIKNNSNELDSENELGNNDFELAKIEKRHIARVLQYTKGNKTEAARLLKIIAVR